MPPMPWMTAADAAAALGVSRATLYAYVSRGRIRSQAMPGSARARGYARDDVERLRRRSEERRAPDKAAAGRCSGGCRCWSRRSRSSTAVASSTAATTRSAWPAPGRSRRWRRSSGPAGSGSRPPARAPTRPRSRGRAQGAVRGPRPGDAGCDRRPRRRGVRSPAGGGRRARGGGFCRCSSRRPRPLAPRHEPIEAALARAWRLDRRAAPIWCAPCWCCVPITS